MSIAMISTGTELLRGTALDTDGAFLGRELVSRGCALDCRFVAGDAPEDICSALAAALKRCDSIVVSGGLGPTDDDVTLESVCRFFGAELLVSETLREKVSSFWARRHSGRCPKRQFRQALIPAGGVILDNPYGSASGIGFDTLYGGRLRHIFLLPGPPAEFEPMAREHLVPLLLRYEKRFRATRGFLAAATGEAALCRLVADALKDFPVEIAVTAQPEGTRLYLSGEDETTVSAAIEAARRAVGSNALPENETELFPFVGRLLLEKNRTLATAESCTGGLVAKKFTDVPGISRVFLGGVVSYSNELKRKILGVPAEILETHGAVSAECARAMADGICRATGADCGISTTGIAGPDGGSAAKPVGSVFVGIRVADLCETFELHLHGNRMSIREAAAARACNFLREMLS
ncbi:MAG: CinA family nicotinamide mononucleotide deamidase-related protein [Victivallaceae bacterium]|nr:CinA family nicotinamide mononucleotide deamidase-related protein [Victivallaceae bacterium]